MNAYQVIDEMSLWWLGRPDQPALIGTLRLLRATSGVSLQYSSNWLRKGFPISEDLPLIPDEQLPTERGSAVGAVDDARPDRWGERVIRFIDKPPRLSLLEYLFFAGDERFGALGVSTSADAYLPQRTGPLPCLADVEEIRNLVRRVEANEPVPEDKRRLIAPGATLGGARPKALIKMDGRQWVVKFAELGDTTDAPLIEHACLTLAKHCAIRVAKTRPVLLSKGHAVAVLRFDRELKGASVRRIHAQSAHVALRAEGSAYGYPELAQLLRRRGPVVGGVAKAHMRELFRRMVFNILIDNTDDHEKNHVLLMNDAQHLLLAPAFDVLPTAQALGYQQMRVGAHANDSTVENACSEAALFGLSKDEAMAEAGKVAGTCARWKATFAKAGVADRDIEYLSQFIDREFLHLQRAELAKPGISKARAHKTRREN
ncbi:MAG: HipA domain-containing protein [Casimicrobiaceae bacterium]